MIKEKKWVQVITDPWTDSSSVAITEKKAVQIENRGPTLIINWVKNQSFKGTKIITFHKENKESYIWEQINHPTIQPVHMYNAPLYWVSYFRCC